VYTTTILDANVDLVKKVYDVNVFGVLSTTQAFAPLLLRAKGTIVNIGSMTSKIQGPYASPYGGSKAALDMMSHAMRQEMEPFGVRVVHVCLLSFFFYMSLIEPSYR
jgi:1-acylglycerone phosphate reductase